MYDCRADLFEGTNRPLGTTWASVLLHDSSPYEDRVANPFWEIRFLGFYFSEREFMPGPLFRIAESTVPYWSLACPLTLLSAYLILWKPRKRTGAEHA